MVPFFRVASAAAFLLATAVTPAWAQATGQLNGRIADESGGVLPGVTVTATQTATGFVRSVVTDDTGSYVMPNLPTGPYRLEVALQGFRTYVQTGIVLQVGGTPTINAQLAVGNLEETVSVEASAPIVDVRSAGISDVVDNERIVELPLQGRQVTDLIVLAGAAVQTEVASSRAMRGGVGISVAGGQSFGVSYLLDGAMHNNPQNNLNLPLPFPDALQEFSVATSGLSAQNGVHAGASVNAVTRSGTNAYHGNAFEFVRDKRFNATEVFAALGPDGRRRDDGLRRNQYGGTLGGPIVRDRLFFFGGYQGTMLRQTPTDLTARVPTAAMLAGDFSAFASPACNGGRQIALRAPFVNNRIDPSLFSPAAVNLAKRLPSSTDPCGEITYSRTLDNDEWQAVSRIDLQAGGNNSYFGRYMATAFEQPAPFSRSDNVLTTGTGGVGLDTLAQSATVGNTRVFGVNTVNALRFAFNRSSVHRGNPPFFEARDLGARLYNYSPNKEMTVNVTGGFNILGGTQTIGIFDTNTYQVSDDLTLVRGNHQIAVGANVAYWKMQFLTNGRSGGDWQFTGAITGLGMSDLMLGRVARLEHGGPGDLPMDMWYWGLYAQDSWRMTSRVTLNAGLRWEPYFGQRVLRDNGVTAFSRENFHDNVRSTVFLNAPAGLLYDGDPGFPSGDTGLDTQWWNFSPRVGVAWDVNGNGRTAVRASYSLGYDFKNGEFHNVSIQQAPHGNGVLLEDPPGGMDDPYGHLGGDPHPILTNANTSYTPYSPFSVLDPGVNSPRSQTWNVTIERQIGSDWGASASYLGSYSDRLWGQIGLNPGVYLGLGPCVLEGVAHPICTTNANINQRRVLSLSGENPAAARLIGILDLHTDVGTQSYRGLKLSAQRRAATGLSIGGNYTLSRCYGDATIGGFPQVASGFTDPAHPAFDRGYCDQDRTHLGSVTVGAQTPSFETAALNALVSGWRASGILSARSGSPLNVTSGRDNAFSGQTGQRAEQVSEDIYGDGSLNQYLNPAAFAQPANGTLGDFPRNGAKGPGYWTIDLAITRSIAFAAMQTLELRVEAFNLLNNFNWGNPVTNFGAGNFGRIQSQAGSPRVMQFGVKYGF